VVERRGRGEDPGEALVRLVGILGLACSGELAAALAYEGHAKSVSDPVERAEIERIRGQELDHRARVIGMLARLGAAPDPRRERKMRRIGVCIALFCRVGGWFFPMYGAGRLERRNIVEYEEAARAAFASGHRDFVEDLILMAEVEWDHERYFRTKAKSHWLWRLMPKWQAPGPREEIRAGLAYCTRCTEAAATLAGSSHSSSQSIDAPGALGWRATPDSRSRTQSE
jgi:rubrerythrin